MLTVAMAGGEFAHGQHLYWCELLGPSYRDAGKNQKKKMKEAYKKMNVAGINQVLNQTPLAYHTAVVDQICGFMACNASSPTPTPNFYDMMEVKCSAKPCKNNVPNTKEAVMNINTNAPNAELVKRDFLQTQVWQIKNRKMVEANKHFHIDDDERPLTMKDFLARIKDGKFTVRKEIMDEEADEDGDDEYSMFDAYHPTSHIRWRDPKKPADKKGLKTVLEKINLAAQKTERELMVLEMDKALKAVETFESQTFH